MIKTAARPKAFSGSQGRAIWLAAYWTTSILVMTTCPPASSRTKLFTDAPAAAGGPMTAIAADLSRRNAARVAGIAYLLTFAIVVAANFGIFTRLSVPGDAAATARNILAHEGLFRLYLACNVSYVAGVIVLLTALYALLAPVHRSLALLAAAFRLIFDLMWLLATVIPFFVLRLLHGAPYLNVFAPEQQQALAKVYLGGGFETYYMGLPFYGLASTVCSYLWLKSGQIPLWLAVWGVIASGWCVITAVAFIAIPHFDKTVNDWLFDSPMALFELAVGALLLFKGIRVPLHDTRAA
jgi:hypothetical protein